MKTALTVDQLKAVIKKFAKRPDGNGMISKHYVILELLSLAENNGVEVSNDLINAAVQADNQKLITVAETLK